MRIACPKCSAGYEVPTAMIGSGKSVRCARCRTVWYVGSAQSAPAPAAIAEAPVAVAPVAAAPVAHPAATVVAVPPVVPPAAEPVAAVIAPPVIAATASPPAVPPPPPPPVPVAEPVAAVPMPEEPIAATTELVPIGHDEKISIAAVHGPNDSVMEDLMREARGKRRRVAPVLAAWVLSLAVVGGGLASAYKYRSQVMDAWPASERVYAVLGITR
jgi:predicted Zn finger-like uncharacterized protein